MYPYNYYSQSTGPINMQSQPSNMPMQMPINWTLINDKPIQSCCEQILLKLPNMISQNITQDKSLEKSFKLQLSSLMQANEILTSNSSKYEKKMTKTSKCLEKYKVEQKKVISLLTKLSLKINKQCTIISNQHHPKHNLLNPNTAFDNLYESFGQLKELLIEHVTVIQRDLRCALSSQERESVLLYEMIDKAFNELLSEVNRLNINEDIRKNNDRIGNIYIAIEEIHSVLVKIPKDILKDPIELKPMILNDNINEDNTPVNVLIDDTFNSFFLKKEQIRQRKKKLNEIYY